MATTLNGKETSDVEMSWGNYTMLRNGIREHIRLGKFSPTDWCVYSTLLLYADWGTGIYFGCAGTIAPVWNGQLNARTVRDSMNRLRSAATSTTAKVTAGAVRSTS